LTGILAQAQYCSHPVFCNETILEAVSKSTLFQKDFKEFVDLVLTVPVEKALSSFERDAIEAFIKNNFVSSDSILQPTNLTDFVDKPSHFSAIKDKELLNFAYELNRRWNELSRKVNINFTDHGSCSSECSTFLEVLDQRTLIIPGGRFKEGYYWDSYWIIKGLIASSMLDTAETLVRNFLIIMKKYGFIPNGFRKYYLNRSQPPFFTLMVKDVTEALYQKGRK
jgi:alpha,alpha-trehalase